MSGVLDVGVRHKIGRFSLDVAFTADESLTVVFGPSGAGKSLTIAAIAGLIKPNYAHVTLRDRILADSPSRVHVPTRHRRVGFVFQDALLLPHRTVLDNVALAVRDRKRARRRESARDLLGEVGAAELADRRPGTLSGGQRQRIALARALAGEPRLLLLDEPFSALDLDTRRMLRSLVRELVDHHRIPTILITHDHDEALELADRIIVYDAGRVIDVRDGEAIADVLRPNDAATEVVWLREELARATAENQWLRQQFQERRFPHYDRERTSNG